MRTSPGQLLLRLLAALFAAAGFSAWIYVAWKALTELDEISPENETGSDLMVWAVSGTVLMIFGAILLHFAAARSEPVEPPEESAQEG